jgi:hypothetical protein
LAEHNVWFPRFSCAGASYFKPLDWLPEAWTAVEGTVEEETKGEGAKEAAKPEKVNQQHSHFFAPLPLFFCYTIHISNSISSIHVSPHKPN